MPTERPSPARPCPAQHSPLPRPPLWAARQSDVIRIVNDITTSQGPQTRDRGAGMERREGGRDSESTGRVGQDCELRRVDMAGQRRAEQRRAAQGERPFAKLPANTTLASTETFRGSVGPRAWGRAGLRKGGAMPSHAKPCRAMPSHAKPCAPWRCVCPAAPWQPNDGER